MKARISVWTNHRNAPMPDHEKQGLLLTPVQLLVNWIWHDTGMVLKEPPVGPPPGSEREGMIP